MPSTVVEALCVTPPLPPVNLWTLLPGLTTLLLALFGAAGGSALLELPPNVAGQVLVTYHFFERLGRLREMFSERSRLFWEAKAAGQGDVKTLKDNTVSALDAFNVLVDTTFKAAGETLTLLRPLAPKRSLQEVSDTEYAKRVAASETERVERLKRLGNDIEP